MVGTSQNKDVYKVGQSGKDKYFVGGGGKSPGRADNKSLTDSNDPVVSSKSAFKYPYDTGSTYKDVGDSGENSNFGGGKVMGIQNDNATGVGGEIPLSYSEKGDWSDKKDAMARRAAMSSNAKDYSSSQYNSPVVDAHPVKVK